MHALILGTWRSFHDRSGSERASGHPAVGRSRVDRMLAVRKQGDRQHAQPRPRYAHPRPGGHPQSRVPGRGRLQVGLDILRLGVVRRGQLLDPGQAAADHPDPVAGDRRSLAGAPDHPPAGAHHHRCRRTDHAPAAARAHPERRGRARRVRPGATPPAGRGDRIGAAQPEYGVHLRHRRPDGAQGVQLRPGPVAGQRRHRRCGARLRCAESGQGPDRRPVHVDRGPVRGRRQRRPRRGERRGRGGRSASHHRS